MTAMVIEHIKASELPSQWVERLHAKPGQTFTVIIEPENEVSGSSVAGMFAVDDPAFGIWRDREEMGDVEAYVEGLRAPRYRPDGSRNKP